MGLVAKNVAISGLDLATFHATRLQLPQNIHKDYTSASYNEGTMASADGGAATGEQTGTIGNRRNQPGPVGELRNTETSRNNRESTANMRVH